MEPTVKRIRDSLGEVGPFYISCAALVRRNSPKMLATTLALSQDTLPSLFPIASLSTSK